MFFCKRAEPNNPLLKQLLEECGMQLIVPARTSIEAGDLIISDAKGQARRAAFDGVFGKKPAVKLKKGGVPDSLSFRSSDKLDTKLAADVSGAMLSTYGMDPVKLAAQLKNMGAARIELALIAPGVTSIENFDAMLGELRQAGAQPGPAYEDNRFFVVEHAYRAKGMRLHAFDAAHALLKASANLVHDLKGGLALDVKAEKDGSYGFRAKEPLVFGVSLRELFYNLGVLRDKPADQLIKIRGAEDRPVSYLSEDIFIALAD